MSEIVSIDGALLDQVRAVCLNLPEAVEAGGVGNPSFKVRDKIFAMQHGMQGRPSLWVKAPRGFQEFIVGADPERCFVPRYVGHHGWVGIYLDVPLEWDFVTQLVRDSYRMTAPKRLVAQIAAGNSSEA